VKVLRIVAESSSTPVIIPTPNTIPRAVSSTRIRRERSCRKVRE
jgi:hypothetical protein